MKSLQPIVLGLLGGVLLFFFATQVHAADELKVILTPAAIVTDQSFTVSVDRGTNNGCQDQSLALFNFKGAGVGDNTLTLDLQGDNNKAKITNLAYKTPQDIVITVTCTGKGTKTGSVTAHITQDPSKQPVDAPLLQITPANPAYDKDVSMSVSKCPVGSTVKYSWANIDGGQSKDSGDVSTATPFVMKFQPSTGDRKDLDTKLVKAICGGKSSNTVTLSFQSPSLNGKVTEPTSTPFPPPCSGAIGAAGCANADTAIGGLATDPQGFVTTVFKFLLGLSGGIAVLVLIAAGYRFMTSQGNPEAVKGAQEMLVSAIAGILFIIFSFALLQIIGIDILHLPGFS